MTSTTQFLESSKYTKPGLRDCHSYVLPDLFAFISHLPPGSRALDVGCGNGSVATELHKHGFNVTGLDLEEAGIEIARASCPAGRFEVLPADAAVLESLDEPPFDLVYSLEVVEHLYDPRSFLKGCFAALKSGGTFICSTPYHGYAKNLAIALANGWDKHANPLFDGGHIKFFSRKTLSTLITDVGFSNLQFRGTGRYPYLWKSMVIAATKP
jgi:2-polyprenyl-3-methyl-5-hydroxy-6-metoxy-1,4-benzoquinol methylase